MSQMQHFSIQVDISFETFMQIVVLVIYLSTEETKIICFLIVISSLNPEFQLFFFFFF